MNKQLTKTETASITVLREEVELVSADMVSTLHDKCRALVKNCDADYRGSVLPEIFNKEIQPENYGGDHFWFRWQLNEFVNQISTMVPAWNVADREVRREVVFNKIYDKMDELVKKCSNTDKTFRDCFETEFRPSKGNTVAPRKDGKWRFIDLCACSPFWRKLTIVAASFLWRAAVSDECKRLGIIAPKLDKKGKLTWN